MSFRTYKKYFVIYSSLKVTKENKLKAKKNELQNIEVTLKNFNNTKYITSV